MGAASRRDVQGLDHAVCHKQRHGDRDVEVALPTAPVAGRAVVLLDDVASTGRTLVAAARGVLAAGRGQCRRDRHARAVRRRRRRRRCAPPACATSGAPTACRIQSNVVSAGAACWRRRCGTCRSCSSDTPCQPPALESGDRRVETGRGAPFERRLDSPPVAVLLLCPLSKYQHKVKVGQPLPFSIRDNSGRLLLARGHLLSDERAVRSAAGAGRPGRPGRTARSTFRSPECAARTAVRPLGAALGAERTCVRAAFATGAELGADAGRTGPTGHIDAGRPHRPMLAIFLIVRGEDDHRRCTTA